MSEIDVNLLSAEQYLPPWIAEALGNARDFSMDIGGSLVKIAFISKKQNFLEYSIEPSLMKNGCSNGIGNHENTPCSEENSCCKNNFSEISLNFVKFQTMYIETSLKFIQDRIMNSNLPTDNFYINITGGGAHKYSKLIADTLNLRVQKKDEMQSLIQGAVFVLQHIKNSCFKFVKDSETQYNYVDMTGRNIFPFLLVNIGSGVSMIKVENENDYQRVGGTSVGGGTLWGLGSLLTGINDYDELMKQAESGQSKQLDLLVSDIYGGAYDLLGLPSDLIASSFGKAPRMDKSLQECLDKNVFCPGDIVKSLLYMISNEIGQIASLHAKLHGLNDIYFGGYFIRDNPRTMHAISFAINYFSQGFQKARFLRHDGYLGAIGALISKITNIHKFGWDENPELKSLLQQSKRYPYLTDEDTFTFSSTKKVYKQLPVVKVLSYASSTRLLSIAEDTHSRNSMNSRVDDPNQKIENDFSRSSVSSRVDDSNQIVENNADNQVFTDTKDIEKSGVDGSIHSVNLSTFGQSLVEFYGPYFKTNIKLLIKTNILTEIDTNGYFDTILQKLNAKNMINVQSIFDVREQFLTEFFPTENWLKYKKDQNSIAFSLFCRYLDIIDSVDDIHKRFFLLFKHIYAGNMYDLGSNDFLNLCLLQPGYKVDFSSALDLINANSSLETIIKPKIFEFVDDLLSSGKIKKILIVADNVGYDFILGIVPLVRELLRAGLKVNLATNSYFALNDIVFNEMKAFMEMVRPKCPILREGLDSGRLRLFETGFGSPFLDLRQVDSVLADGSDNTDLIILEGPYKSFFEYDLEYQCSVMRVATVTIPIPTLCFEKFEIYFDYQSYVHQNESDGK